MGLKKPFKRKPVNFIALTDNEDDIYGIGTTVQEAVEHLRARYAEEYYGGSFPNEGLTVYGVTRAGKVKVTVEWVSE